MKPWLMELLACPIDKHYPLHVIIFEIENSSEITDILKDQRRMSKDLSFFLMNMEDRLDGDFDDEEKHEIPAIVNSYMDGGVLQVQDTLSIKPLPINEYLDLITGSIRELEPLENKSHAVITTTMNQLSDLGTKIQEYLNDMGDKGETKQHEGFIDSIKDDLVLLNWFKQVFEIQTGIMQCPECNRWYPIRKTIPQMLPDSLRKRDEEIAFLETWSDYLDDSYLNEGLPYHL
ncbi:hypothetical protein GF325_12890 [Candidatus Bathyarchaeota archaeon]|nr:hypothetical protein [Candidatus Bathyarchaeota archaeon]